jgi:hypothetical protein
MKHVEPSKSVPQQDKKFIEITTVEEIREIDVCVTNITTILQELEEQQENAFNEQNKITKRYYDMFSKYEGSEQSSDWMWSSWFGLYFTPDDKWWWLPKNLLVVYYESRKREIKTRPIRECRCNERLKSIV